MASKRVLSEPWIIFAFSLFLNYHLTDGAPFYIFNGTQNKIQFNERNAHLIQSPVDVMFEGNNYKQFYISNDGYITFTTDKTAVRYIAQNWSSTDVSPFVDIPFIAPYYFKAYPLDVKPGYVGLVHYQELTQSSGNGQDLQTLGHYIKKVMVSGKQFSPTWGMVVSWENITSDSVIQKGTCDGTQSNLCPVNTFQLLLLSDGKLSFAIFNYYSLNVPVEKYHQAGFNGGNGIGFYSVLGPSVGVGSLLTLQSSDTAGRYVFDITNGVIQRGGCNTDITDTRLRVYPNYAGMFGGKVIDISGPCFPTSPRCRFTDINSGTTFNGTVVSVTQAKMRCVVPRMTVRGKVQLSVSVNNGNNYAYQTPFTIVFPGRIPGSRHVTAEATTSNMAWYSTNTTSMTLSWDPSLLANTSHVVDITLYGYREASGQSMYTMLTKLGTGINGRLGTYTVDPSKNQCSGQTCFDYEVGLLEVRLQDGVTPQQYKFLSSKAIPLGWYVRSAMTSRHGSNWPSQMCVNWYNTDKQDMSWTNNLLSCPCSLSQALADFGRWQPDNGCNLMNAASPNNCFYHRGAVHCVRAVQPTQSGAGNQCCYNQAYTLVYAADSFQGSTPDKSHDWGAAPYVMPGYVPSLSHWIKDVVTFYYCCLWTGYGSCDYYMDLRPTKDCIAYVPPVLASVFGQGHVMSFGGDAIRILGQGDYNLLKAAKTIIQGRFENRTVKMTGVYEMSYAYILSAVSVQDAGTSDTIELRLRPSNFDRSIKHIDVRVNKKLVTFNEDSMRWQDFKGIAVVNTDYTRKLQSNFTVILTNGIGFQVAEVSETLQLDVMVPSSFGSVTGIFGTLGGNLTRPNGTSIDVSTITTHDLYYTYELPWAVKSDQTSLFTNHIPANFSSISPVNLNRTAAPDVRQSSIVALCQSDTSMPSMPCTFDYTTTGSADLARSSLNAQKRYMALTESLQPVRTCGLLNVPRATKNNYSIALGTQTSLTGCRYGVLSGPTTYTCTATSNQTQAWSPAVTTSCQYPTEEASTVLIVAILVPCVVVVFIAIIAVVCVYKMRKKRRNAEPPSMQGYDAGYSYAADVKREQYPRRASNEYTV